MLHFNSINQCDCGLIYSGIDLCIFKCITNFIAFWLEWNLCSIHTERIVDNNSIFFLNCRFIFRISWNMRTQRCTYTANQNSKWTVWNRIDSFIALKYYVPKDEKVHTALNPRAQGRPNAALLLFVQCNPQYAIKEYRNKETKYVHTCTLVQSLTQCTARNHTVSKRKKMVKSYVCYGISSLGGLSNSVYEIFPALHSWMI